MAQPSYGAFTQQPNDYSLELADIERRKKLAAALQEQGMQGTGGTEMVGGWAIPKSPMEGLGKAAQQISGAYQQKMLTEEEKDIAKKQRTEESQANSRVLAAALGAPNMATDPTRLATAMPQWTTDAQPDLVPKAPSPEERKRLLLSEMLNHPNPAYRNAAMTAMIAPLTKDQESAFAKIDPSKFTADSVSKFAQTGNHAVLVPRDKLEFQNIGGNLLGLNPYSGAKTTDIATTIKPGDAAKLAQEQFQWQNLSANQRVQGGIAQGHLANEGARTNFETGSGVGGPVFNGLPQTPVQPVAGQPQPVPVQSAPVQRPAAPQGAPVQPAFAPGATTPNGQPIAPTGPKLTGATQQAIAKEQILKKSDMDIKRDFNMGGLGSAIDEARNVLLNESPTSSGVGAAADYVASLGGYAPSGAVAADKLRAIGGVLVSKMPRMEGPQSDKDVENYHLMAGRVGDQTLPIERRLAALQTVESLWRKYDKQDATTPKVPANSPTQPQERRKNVTRYNENGERM